MLLNYTLVFDRGMYVLEDSNMIFLFCFIVNSAGVFDDASDG